MDSLLKALTEAWNTTFVHSASEWIQVSVGAAIAVVGLVVALLAIAHSGDRPVSLIRSLVLIAIAAPTYVFGIAVMFAEH